MLLRLTLFTLLFFPFIAEAVEYKCIVEKKIDSGLEYTSEQIIKGQYSVEIKEGKNETVISRCSFVESEQKVTCDEYKVDKVVLDSNVRIKKYYLFQSQYDIQLFPSMLFVENNGRGGIAFGKYKVTAP